MIHGIYVYKEKEGGAMKSLIRFVRFCFIRASFLSWIRIRRMTVIILFYHKYRISQLLSYCIFVKYSRSLKILCFFFSRCIMKYG